MVRMRVIAREGKKERDGSKARVRVRVRARARARQDRRNGAS